MNQERPDSTHALQSLTEECVMKKLLGFLLILAGAALGLYVGGWLCLIGGIVDVVDGTKATPTNGGLIAWGLVKALLLAGLAGVVAFWVLAAPGVGLLFSKKRRSRRANKASSL